jgi:hypothetical protein
MNGILVRIAVDQSYGHWNAPVDESTGEFVFVPIPDGEAKHYSPGCRVTYEDFRADLRGFAEKKSFPNDYEFGFPMILRQCSSHLDPDFRFLTYGDNGAVRGKGIRRLKAGDLLVFYSGLRSIQRPHVLVYALTGLFVIEGITRALDIPAERHSENAHTRWDVISPNDIVVRGRADTSGRLQRCIVIGEFRNRAYRITRELEATWGGLSVKDGYIQRSVVPPSFCDAGRFYDWFLKQNIELVERNN